MELFCATVREAIRHGGLQQRLFAGEFHHGSLFLSFVRWVFLLFGEKIKGSCGGRRKKKAVLVTRST
jgi:hypothetical protein